MRLLIVAVILGLALPATAGSPRPKLSLSEAVELALQLHPGRRVARYLTEASRHIVGQAESAYYPKVFLGAQWIGGSIAGSDASYLAFPDFPRIPTTSPSQRSAEERAKGTNDLTPWASYLGGVSVGVPIYDFGRTRGRVVTAEGLVRESEASERTVREQIVVGVQRAYYGALGTERIVQVTRETLDRLQLHAEWARQMVKQGMRAGIDQARAEADAARGQLRLIAVQNDLRIARVVLDNAIGMRVQDRYDLVDERVPMKIVAQRQELLTLARQARPEFGQVRGQMEARRGQVETARAGILPFFAGTASVNARGVGGVANVLNYDAGLVMGWPIFDGYLYRKRKEEAKARLRSLEAAFEELAQRVEMEVRTAFSSMRSAEEMIRAAQVSERLAKENLEMAGGRFQQGMGSIIELTDAEELYATAQANVVRAIYEYQIAVANLERAVGRKLERK